MDQTAYKSDLAQPHWTWALFFVVVPLALTIVGFFGLWSRSFVPFGVAASSPRLGLALALAGFAAALVRRKRTAIAITAVGLALSSVGYLVLFWLSE